MATYKRMTRCTFPASEDSELCLSYHREVVSHQVRHGTLCRIRAGVTVHLCHLGNLAELHLSCESR